MSEIDTEMYLRDGAPHATVCRVVMKDGRIGIGLYRHVLGTPFMGTDDYDALALSNALAHLHERPEPDLEADMAAGRAFTVGEEPDHDLQASLGQKAHE